MKKENIIRSFLLLLIAIAATSGYLIGIGTARTTINERLAVVCPEEDEALAIEEYFNTGDSSYLYEWGLPGHLLHKSVALDTLEQRIFSQYGEGDAGVEEMLYLKTGVHQDFMGRPREGGRIAEKPDYIVCLRQNGTILYDIYGVFVAFVPFDSTSKWDQTIMADNL